VPYDGELEKWFGKGDIDPDSFYRTIKWLAEYGKGTPIYITENGICDYNDEIRPRYMILYLAAMHRAIQEGVPVKGYFYWSLIDNFEWAEGFGLRFGLIRNDFVTQKRTPKPSAEIYARIIRENGIADQLIEQFGKI
jgi:beta-glucosidase